MNGFSQLSALMRKETALLSRFERQEIGLHELLRERKWTALEGALSSLRALQRSIVAVEEQRRALFSELVGREPSAGGSAGGKEGGAVRSNNADRETERFMSLLESMPVVDRLETESAYHGLKLAVLRVQGAVLRLSHYVGAVSGTLEAVLQEILPHRKGTIYERTGDQRERRSEALVVDTVL